MKPFVRIASPTFASKASQTSKSPNSQQEKKEKEKGSECATSKDSTSKPRRAR